MTVVVRFGEAREKLARGLYLLIREATNARNLHALLPLVTPKTNRRICLCTDDLKWHAALDGYDPSVECRCPRCEESWRVYLEPQQALRLALMGAEN